ncbi:carboxymuconolactone decarboxylase family protein [Ideonella sp. DXS29W]|uniref:Carboxymuconolactone decarboxylase family protein n=1 Tax=Ideonella lacteola TaxID=2984193 RepID=A0ABU9BJU7_9BURK
MPRIEPVAAPYSAPLAERFARLIPPSMTPPAIFRTVARNEGLFIHLVDSGLLGPTGLLDRRALPPALRELLILRTCFAARNDYEWHLHVDTISERMGLSRAQIADTRSAAPDPALWSERERAAMALVDALVPAIAVSDSLFSHLREHFDDPTLIEMTQLVGLYTGAAMLVALTRPQRDVLTVSTC